MTAWVRERGSTEGENMVGSLFGVQRFQLQLTLMMPLWAWEHSCIIDIDIDIGTCRLTRVLYCTLLYD